MIALTPPAEPGLAFLQYKYPGHSSLLACVKKLVPQVSSEVGVAEAVRDSRVAS